MIRKLQWPTWMTQFIDQLADSRSWEEILVFAALPTGWDAQIVGQHGQHNHLRVSAGISAMRLKNRPRLLITVVGQAERDGPIPFDAVSDPKPVPSGWWTNTGCKVHVFAFTCHSWEYLRTSAIRRHIDAAIGFEGLLWVSDHTATWIKLVSKARQLIRARGQVNSQAFNDLKLMYTKAAEEKHTANYNDDWVINLCLERQARMLRIVS